MPRKTDLSAQAQNTSPDYIGLVEFLIEPFLDNSDSLHVDCEELNQKKRVWLRVAFDSTEKGKVFGRGGRNIQAIRTVLNTAATIVGQSVYLEIYNSDNGLKANPLSTQKQKPIASKKPKISKNQNSRSRFRRSRKPNEY
ncbi:KH domain-containing protein [Pleurocapsales cyanobacterium LEGE 06147]|nr:KH domain-containing protein [Pleurocapsales cyanobacterium LEGE 06147]